MIQGVAGVIIWTDNLDRLSSFYRDTLGLTPHSVRPDFVAFSFGDVRLSLGLHSEVAGESRDPYRVMVNLGVNDIQLVADRLLQEGVEFLRKPERESWGGWVATFRDPDGNVLQLLQQPQSTQH
jgi:predicted enzyme related to lactoylglutathione lyase